jgi:hypothetical protein
MHLIQVLASAFVGVTIAAPAITTVAANQCGASTVKMGNVVTSVKIITLPPQVTVTSLIILTSSKTPTA